ncbi:MAG: hypothetical protein JO363_14610, partial [Solirubrobacterales bacterium]|nr:hypothetical protein [Solirubrobacterales bacterium]
MRKYKRPLWAVVAVGMAVAVAACGSSSSSSKSSASSASSSSSSGASSSGGKTGGTITIDSGTPPQSADQGLDFTTQGNELYSVINVPLLTFKRGVTGTAGAEISPALATSLPDVSNGGKTYTFHLRPGLHYSNGTPVKISDVILALERDIKIPSQAASFVSANIAGGTA